ncbi:fatty-acyl-CoA synthase [Herbihabitans rhizosphaerae]|uniref:Fatty-acyl-CoA synthase n=1 Tax=Herbihabitans rhizosphaerae TaxID=1872711 RepID=A0A4Q7KUX5_9PSEU|nr:fatty acyl-AMP ligase [Herbihabitans rhizosphaerae]RZS40809.1 fatty-acyl-CoA synthase [Herbihabitans rhizosphaerae]
MSRFVDRLLATARADDQRGVTTGEPNAPVRRTWAEVHDQARRTAGALLSHGVGKHDAVAVLAAEPAAIGPAVQAVWLVGGSVTMLHQPTPRTDLAVWAQDTLRVLSMIGSKLVLLGAPFDQVAPVLEEHGIGYLSLAALDGGEPLAEFVEVDEDAPALLQLTSGSTAEPKAVRISHGNLITNIDDMATVAELDLPEDIMVSWLPMFHDMGMVGFFTVPMTLGVELVKITPIEFLGAPLLWAELISRYQATITAAPNFAYAMLGRRLSNVDEGAVYDLSRLRIALNGAEPIDEKAVRSFTDGGARFGMPAECVFPAYGMAEGTLAISFAPLFTGLTLDRIDADELEQNNRAVPVDESDVDDPERNVRAFAKLGPPLPSFEVEIVDEQGNRRGDREVGEIRLRGAAVTAGYLTVDGPVSTLDDEGWLATGDLGYLADGQIVICGRAKDVIILAGRNIYPTDIERAASTVDGVRAGNAVAVRIDAGTRRERFAVVVESKLAGDAEQERRLVKEVGARVFESVNARPVAVVVLPAGTLPKTPSGKLRRAAAGEKVADRIG